MRWSRLVAVATLSICGGLAFGQTRPDWIRGAPEFMFNGAFGIEVWQWLGLIVVALVGFAVAMIGREAVILGLRARERLIKGPMSHSVRRLIRRAASVLIFAWTCLALAGELSLPPHADLVVTKILNALHILGYILAGCAVWEMLAEEIALRASGHSAKAEKLLVPLASKLIRATIIGAGALIGIAELTNVNIPALVTSLGIGGLVVALAAKDSIENIFGSITILFDMPFAIGDWVKIDKVEGVVEEINLRSTRIRTFEDTVITLPNANLIRAAVENFGERRVRRQKFSVRLSSDNSPEAIGRLSESVRTFIGKMKNVQHDRVIVALESIDDAAVGLFIQCHFEATTQQDEMRMRDALLHEVMVQRDRCGVLLAAESRAAQLARHGKRPLQ